MLFALLGVVLSLFVFTDDAMADNTPVESTGDEEFELFSVEGYRLYRYRSPTPLESDYAVTVDSKQLQQLLASSPKPVLLDVQPVTWNKVFLVQKPRLNIPGSVWLPNVGLGELEQQWQAYFSNNLEKLTAGNMNYPVVIYCRADCWMSWNALQRASEWGYSNLYWYRNGSDGWAEADLPLVESHPIPFQPLDE